MAFMERQVIHDEWIKVNGPDGTTYIPADLVDDPNNHWDDASEAFDGAYLRDVQQYVEGRVDEHTAIEKITGWGARLSAPGYLDCTDWSVFDTEQEAEDFLTEEYGDEDE